MNSDPLEPPTWLRTKYKWGPVKHPLYWCQVVEDKELDCGSLSAIIREVYESRGVVALPVQMILEYPTYTIEHWVAMWHKRGLSVNWVWGRYVYHEAVGVVYEENKMKIYDPVENAWIDSSGCVERGRIVAIRIVGKEAHDYVYWGDVHVKLNKWHVLR
jgi:hypothetical protein